MAEGFKNLRRGLEIKMHEIVNDAARDITDRVNRFEPAFKAKPSQTGSGPEMAEVTVTGAAELSKEKQALVRKSIDEAIEKTLGR